MQQRTANQRTGNRPRAAPLLRTALMAVLAVTLSASFTTPAGAIVGGEDVTYPWAAALIKPDDGTSVEARTYCSGVLIKSRWVLTAAHCFDNSRDERGDTVTIGRGRLASGGGQKRTISDVVKMYNNGTYCPSGARLFCDIALVELNQPSTQPDLDLANAQVMSEWGVGTAARVYGYGRAALGVFSGHLRRGSVRIDDLHSNHHHLTVSGPGTAACFGDSGGPLVVSTSQGPRLVAVVSLVDSVCTPGAPSFLIKVGYRGSATNSPAFLWITNTI